MNNDIVYKALTGKLTKDWLHFLMKDTLLHSKEAKLYSKTLNFVDSSMNIFNRIHDEQKMVIEKARNDFFFRTCRLANRIEKYIEINAKKALKIEF